MDYILFIDGIITHLKNSNKDIATQKAITYVNWNRQNCPLPVTFTIQDIDELKNLPKQYVFARKFDIAIDEKILDTIDIQ